MGCFHPLPAWRSRHGGITFRLKDARSQAERLELPCGRCFGCRHEYRRQWTMRCVMEAETHADNSFITLTYDDAHCPDSVQFRHLQLFFKRLRKEVGKVRYYACGEYGKEHSRPHYHAILFGYRFEDCVFLSGAGENTLYTSPLLERIWPFGFSTVGSVSYNSCAYVTGYVLKKSRNERDYINTETGEYLSPEFVTMSRRPGIGHAWLEKYKQETLRDDNVRLGSQVMLPPRYFVSKLSDVEQLALRARRAAGRDEDKSLDLSLRAYSRERVARSKHAAHSRRKLEE